MSLQETSFSWHCSHFFEESQLQLIFYVFEVAIVVPLFSFFRLFLFLCTIPRFAHSLFNVGLLLSSLGSSEGAPPPLQSCFWLFYTDIESSRVESSSSSGTPYLHVFTNVIQFSSPIFYSRVAFKGWNPFGDPFSLESCFWLPKIAICGFLHGHRIGLDRSIACALNQESSRSQFIE